MSIDINLSSQEHDMQSDEDEVLSELQTALDPIITKIDADEKGDRAIFVMGVCDVLDSDGESIGVKTILDTAGDTGLMQEGIYTVLMNEIEDGNPELFEALRAVIRKIEEEKDLEPTDSLLIPESRVLH